MHRVLRDIGVRSYHSKSFCVEVVDYQKKLSRKDN